jgi:hypothetical protein
VGEAGRTAAVRETAASVREAASAARTRSANALLVLAGNNLGRDVIDTERAF